ncbi:GNAT family N-acetyltransferase [Streptomyces lunaelactis]|uniref:GNAT family N-acetyltransferase n=1 Tax=Streptomyces lunaelactis TaxID=1535768 RepID=UPI001584EFA6|nr:GNAT family N-acetyltransferase [Streptomyces lunaelactis]NUL04360.1 GNAT family N-acetyltransferase [Streptomyces lunaelactis]
MNSAVVLPVTTASGPVRVTSPAPRAAWWQLAHADESALVSQTPTWLDAICATGPFADASRLYEFEGGRRLVVPLARRRARPAWLAAEESWPSDWGIGGPMMSPGVLDEAEARLVFHDLAQLPALRVAVRFGPGAYPAWARAVPQSFRTEDHMTQVVDLDGGFDAVWERRFHGRARRNVRRAERSAVDVEVDRTGRLVPVFYRLYEQSMVRWAEQQHEPLALARWRQTRNFPKRKLEAVADRLGESCAIYVASTGGEPAAAIVVLRHGAHARCWRGAMDRDLAHPVRANFLLHRLAIEDACAAGCRYYHMGESRPGSSLAGFKEGFGADGHPSPCYSRERLPVSAAERRLEDAVKRLIRFQEA